MMVLKTLKDIKQRSKNFDGDYLLRLDLRQEAIKRVKVWEIQKEKFRKIGNEAGVNCVEQIQNEFIEFFNITEEDLK